MRRGISISVILVVFNLVCVGFVWSYTYVPEGHVIEGMSNFARSLTRWVTDTKTLEVKQVYVGATETIKAVPYKARFTLPVLPPNLAIITRVAIQAGVMVGTYYLGEWLADATREWWLGEDGKTIYKMGAGDAGPIPANHVVDPIGDNPASCSYYDAGANITYQYYAIPSGQACSSPSTTFSSFSNTGYNCTQCGMCPGGVYATSGCQWWNSTSRVQYMWLRLDSGVTWTETEGDPVVVGWGEVDAALEADFLANRQNGYELARDAMAAVGPGVATQNQGWPQSGPDAPGNGMSPEQGAEVQTALNDSVTEDIKTQLDTAAADDPDNPYGGWDDWEYSPNEIATAIETKLKPYLEPGEVTIDAEGDPPDKDSLPDVLDEFHDGVSSWEGLTLLNSLTLETNSANCNFCIDKPEILGLSGQVCWDCCPHESMLAGLGNILFGIMALCWLFWIFM